jgi:anti-anti-sigma factor
LSPLRPELKDRGNELWPQRGSSVAHVTANTWPNWWFEATGGGQHGHVELDAELVQPESLRIEARRSATETVLTLEGELDLSGSEWFGTWVRVVLEAHPGTIAIDARGLTYTDSSGLRSLLLARESAQEAGASFRIDNPSPELRHLVERTGLQALLLDE